MTVSNPGVHKHRTTLVGGQQVCMDCSAVVITPILERDDERLAANGQPASLWLDAIKSLAPAPLDFLLLEMVHRLGIEVPDYIAKLGTHYEDEPPHIFNGSVPWWRD